MAANGFAVALLCFAMGAPLSIAGEYLVAPLKKPRFTASALLLGLGLYGALYAALLLLTARPICSLLFSLAFELVLVLVNNAKYKSLDEPFLYQDYDYFLDTLKFPRLFLPFLGWKSFLLAALGCLAAIGVLVAETPASSRLAPVGVGGAAALLISLSLPALWLGSRLAPGLSLNPLEDLRAAGFLPLLWLYGARARRRNIPESPLTTAPRLREPLPHLVAWQSESFFDARRLFAGVDPRLYANLDKFARSAFARGELTVPAWGANTSRTECAFLTGIPPADLDVAQFNPYQALRGSWRPFALPAALRSIGYRTVCVHPYYGEFYGRRKITPRLGFDEFLDIKDFVGARRDGPYVGDLALGEKIIELIEAATRPTFVFAISMENHGPLALEAILPEHARFYKTPPPAGCEELGVYLAHVERCDQTLGLLYAYFSASPPLSFCFYGDHPPIMPACYQAFSPPPPATPYFCWSNRLPGDGKPRAETAANLALFWLRSLAANRSKSEGAPE